MNQKKSKALRKLIYKDINPREREYGAIIRKKELGKKLRIPEDRLPIQIVNTGNAQPIGDKKVSLRRIYQRCKKIVRNLSIKNMREGIFIS